MFCMLRAESVLKDSQLLSTALWLRYQSLGCCFSLADLSDDQKVTWPFGCLLVTWRSDKDPFEGECVVGQGWVRKIDYLVSVLII